MPDPTPLDELMTAWRKLGEESLTAVRRAFDAGRAQPFAASAAEDAPAPPPPPPPHADEPPPPAPDAAADLRAILERVESIDARLAHIEASLAALTLVDDDVSWLADDDYDDDDIDDIIPVRGMELRVKGMKRGRKRRKK